MNQAQFKYDVGLSFAGEQREFVEMVAEELKSRGIRVFFDDYERDVLWGKDLYAHLCEVYQRMCRFCVIFVSKEYAEKVWTNQERQSAQARAMSEKQEYILPARFDDTPIPGLLDTVGYIDLNETTPIELCDLLRAKLGKDQRQNYLPPTLDRLFCRLRIEDDHERQERAYHHADCFLDVLQRMTPEERDTIIAVMWRGCPHDMPDNIHIHTDLLSRVTDKSVARLKRILGGVRSLGFVCTICEGTESENCIPGTPLGSSDYFYLVWINLRGDRQLSSLQVAREMIVGATEDYCEEHGSEFLKRLDFSQLASSTATSESH